MKMRVPIFFLAVLVAGCDSSGLQPVRGRVTMNGQPVNEGRVTFYPETGTMAQGVIGAGGEYRLTTFKEGDGAMPGKHRVVIKATRVNGPAPPASFQEEMTNGSGNSRATVIERLVPEQYSRVETTPLTAEVVRGTNGYDFELKSE